MTALSESYAPTEERTDYNQIKMLGVIVEIHFTTAYCYTFTCKRAICYDSSGFFTPYKAGNTLILVTAIQSFGYRPFFKSWDIRLKLPSLAHQFLSNKYQFWDCSFWMFNVSLFPPVFPGFAFAKRRSFVFQSGKFTGSESGGVIDLTLDEEDDTCSQGRWKIISCRDDGATSGISSREWQKGINFCYGLVYFFLGVSVK